MANGGDGEKKGSCTPHTKFLCSLEGILKIIEFFTVLIAWAICAHIYDTTDDVHKSSRYIFFLIVGIICWVFTIFVILFNLFGCFNKCIFGRLMRTYGWFFFLLAYSLSWFFFWLSGGFMLAWHYWFRGGNAAVAFFSFINTILFLIDSIMYYRICRKYRVIIRKNNRGLLDAENV